MQDGPTEKEVGKTAAALAIRSAALAGSKRATPEAKTTSALAATSKGAETAAAAKTAAGREEVEGEEIWPKQDGLKTVNQHLPCKGRFFCFSYSRAPSSPSPKRDTLFLVDSQDRERCISFQRNATLRPLFNCIDVDGKSTKAFRNFSNALGVITHIGYTGCNVKVRDHLAGAKYVFLKIRLAKIESLDLKI